MVLDQSLPEITGIGDIQDFQCFSVEIRRKKQILFDGLVGIDHEDDILSDPVPANSGKILVIAV